MRKINKIKIFQNNNEKSENIAISLIEKLLDKGFKIVERDHDLAIAIGGDGSFLRMIKANKFSDETYYLGINAGTLGFAQEIYPKDIDNLIDKLNNNDYKTESIGVQETKVFSNKTYNFCSLNEIVIRDSNLNTAHLDIYINNMLLENFVGDGILISTSFGSTAYNLSFGGSILYNDFHTLQITPIAPLNNKSYRTLLNSVVIPEDRIISIIPQNESLFVTVDGENNIYNNVSKIETSVKKKKINCLRMIDYDYTKKINEKFLKD